MKDDTGLSELFPMSTLHLYTFAEDANADTDCSETEACLVPLICWGERVAFFGHVQYMCQSSLSLGVPAGAGGSVQSRTLSSDSPCRVKHAAELVMVWSLNSVSSSAYFVQT